MTIGHNRPSIVDLNDAFRKNAGLIDDNKNKVVMTRGVSELPHDRLTEVFAKVRGFTEFTEDNDPYGEHDFGAFDHNGEKFFWKIDYYDNNLEHGSEDPADSDMTARVLTVMYANEY